MEGAARTIYTVLQHPPTIALTRGWPYTRQRPCLRTCICIYLLAHLRTSSLTHSRTCTLTYILTCAHTHFRTHVLAYSGEHRLDTGHVDPIAACLLALWRRER